MATTTIAKSYNDVPPSYHEGTITVSYKWDGGSNPLGVLNDILRFFKLPRNAKLLDGSIEIEAIDTHATPTGELSVLVTDGTTTYTLDSAIPSETAALIRFDGTGWLGEVLTGTGQWRAEVKATTAAATAAASPYIALTLSYTMDLAAGEHP